jgi:hypothetical protein
MAKKSRATAVARVESGATDLFIDILKEFAPGSTQRLINSSIEFMEARREFLAERIARLEKVRTRISSARKPQASRAVPVRARRASRARRTSAA